MFDMSNRPGYCIKAPSHGSGTSVKAVGSALVGDGLLGAINNASLQSAALLWKTIRIF